MVRLVHPGKGVLRRGDVDAAPLEVGWRTQPRFASPQNGDRSCRGDSKATLPNLIEEEFDLYVVTSGLSLVDYETAVHP